MDLCESFTKLVETIEILRGDRGCPWDREQTLHSLGPYLLEECQEVLKASHNGNIKNLKEELGDLLSQCIMWSQIASEQGLFTLKDILEEAREKLIRRHPHVFSGRHASSSKEALEVWKDMKTKEKETL